MADAVSELRTAVGLDPKVDALHFALGSALFKSGDQADAISELQTAARLGPTANHHDQLGVAYASVNNMTGARQEFLAALAVDPNFPPARRHIAMLNGH